MKYSKLILRAAASAIFPVAALAQSAPLVPKMPDPTDARVPVPPIRYESSFGGYRPVEAASPTEGWRSRNEDVGRAGVMSMTGGMDPGAMDGMDRGSPENAKSTPPDSTDAAVTKRPATSDGGEPGMNMPAGGHHHLGGPR